MKSENLITNQINILFNRFNTFKLKIIFLIIIIKKNEKRRNYCLDLWNN